MIETLFLQQWSKEKLLLDCKNTFACLCGDQVDGNFCIAINARTLEIEWYIWHQILEDYNTLWNKNLHHKIMVGVEIVCWENKDLGSWFDPGFRNYLL